MKWGNVDVISFPWKTLKAKCLTLNYPMFKPKKKRQREFDVANDIVPPRRALPY